MLDTTPPLAEALAHHQRGNLNGAAAVYRQILCADPKHPDAWHLLGVLALQGGDALQAVQFIERAIALRPGAAAFYGNLGEAYRLCGRLDKAVAYCRVALQLQPDCAEAANNLGSLLLQQGLVEEATTLFQRAVHFAPGFAPAFNNLGNACRLAGQLDQALAHFRRAVEADPDLAHAHGNLGQLLLECNQLEGALHHCREAARLQPDSAQSQNNLGNTLRKMGQLGSARACYGEALRLAPEVAMIHANLGQVSLDEGQTGEATRWFRQALEREPSSAHFHAKLADAFSAQDDKAQAEDSYRVALGHDPRSLDARLGLARLRDQQSRLDEARDECLAALRLQPGHADASCLLGKVLLELDRPEEAFGSFRSALAGDPGHAASLAQLATHLRDRLPPEEENALRTRLGEPLLPPDERASLLFGLAQVCDARAEYDAAARHLESANALEQALRRQRGRAYDAPAHAWFVDQILAIFTPAFFDRVRGRGPDSERPVFIVGLPRSGTTLLEQVLASHSHVFGAGELRLARDDFEALGRGPDGISEPRSFETLGRTDPDWVRPLAAGHLARLDALAPAAERVTDKMPDNYLYLGLLAALFPKARFLHCVRDLRDVAVSCWMTHFREIPWANSPEDIASRFAQYGRVMQHWRQVLPSPVLEVGYEEMVHDPEGVARRVVAWCGLEWEAGCLDFHRSGRPVRTASVAQVRRPIYRGSLARWRHYEESLRPLLALLPDESFSLPGRELPTRS